MRSPPSRPRHPTDGLRRLWWIVVIVVVSVAAVVAVLAVVPVLRTTSFRFGGAAFGTGPVHFNDSWAQPLCPAGAKAVMVFSSTGLNVTFGITAPNGTQIWSQHTAYANVSFVIPACGIYQIGATGSGDGNYAIDGVVSYTAPLL